jgi:hypothetical protein
MKKLLSAVTSAVMGISLVTSAFASSFSASAAGSVSAVQPSAVLSDVADSAIKQATDSIVLSFANAEHDDSIDGAYLKATPGEVLMADLMIDTELALSGFEASINMDDPIEIDAIDSSCEAFGASILSNFGDTLKDKTDRLGNTIKALMNGVLVTGDQNTVPDTSKAFMYIDFSIPADIEDGLYEITMPFLSFRQRINQVGVGVDDVTFEKTYILVGDLPTTTTTTTAAATTTAAKTTTTVKTTTTAAATTTVSEPSAVSTAPVVTDPGDIIAPDPDGNISWDIQDKVAAKPGETVTVPVLVVDSSDSLLPVAGAQFGISFEDADGKISYAGVSDTSGYGAKMQKNESALEFAFATSDGSGSTLANGEEVFYLTFKVADDCAAGEYAVNFSDATVSTFISDTNGNDITGQVELLAGSILVSENETIPEGEIAWDIQDQVTAKPGDTVTVPVLVVDDSNSLLPVAGAQFGITYDNANGEIAYAGVSDTVGYGAAMQENADALEFAFATSDGAGTTLADGEQVFYLTFTVSDKCAAGEYAVDFSDSTVSTYISDTNGNDLTSQVKLIAGSILVVADTTTTTIPAGEIAWDIQDQVTAKPGETVTVPVLVVDDSNSLLPIAGAQFGITYDNADGEIAYAGVSEESGYGAAMQENADALEFAFATSDGAGKAVANGEQVFYLTFTVSDNCAAGEYAVDFSDSTVSTYISDTNGNDLSGQVKLIAGSILVVADTTTTTTTTLPAGEIAWDIQDQVTAKPGETVTVPVLVVDDTDSLLPIAGAQFGITYDNADGEIAYAGVSEESGYGAAMQENANTLEFAFATSDGAGNSVANGGQVFYLTFTVSDKCAAGEYPVDFSDANVSTFISDANGNDLSGQVKLIAGSILVVADTTTTTIPAGEIAWDIQDQVTAKPGETVTVPVLVVDDSNTLLPIAGAQFGITFDNANGEITYAGVSAESGYGAAMQENANALEFAFATSDGASSTVADGGQVFYLTFTVSDKCAAGEYAVDFSNATVNTFICDADGNDLTSQVKLIAGSILIVADTTTTTTVPTTAATTTTTTAPAATTTAAATTTTTAAATTTTTKASTTTTTTTVTTPAVTTTVTSVSIPDGAVGWDISDDTVYVSDVDQTVTLYAVVKNGTVPLPIAGAQFTLVTYTDFDTEEPDNSILIATVVGSEAYSSTLKYNESTYEAAFTTPDGLAVAAEDEAIVFTLEVTVPAGTEVGRYYVDFAKDQLSVVDQDQNDITKWVVPIEGWVDVLPAVTTTTSSTTTTTTTTTTTSTTTTTATTTTVTTTTAAIPAGAILINGETVNISYSDSDRVVPVEISVGQVSSGSKPITEMSFVISNADDIEYVSVDSDKFTVEYDPATGTVTLKSIDPNGATLEAGDVVITVGYNVPGGTPEGTYAAAVIDTSSISAKDADGADAFILVGEQGKIVIGPAAVVGVSTVAEIETVPGYYFSHDNRGFNKSQVVGAKLTTYDADGNVVETVTLTSDDINFGDATPDNTYSYDADATFEENFTYQIPVYYGDDLLKDADGNVLTITAYIGVKGDVDLNNLADGVDSSFVLQYYAKIQTGSLPEETPIVEKNVFEDPEIENLVAFLGDVDVNEYDPDNWGVTKTEEHRLDLTRRVDAVDSSFILQFYTYKQTNRDLTAQEIWATLLGVDNVLTASTND